MLTTAPALFALSHGIACEGPHSCFFCGAACGEDHPRADFLRDTFTGLDAVARRSSEWVCPGCVLCLREDMDVPLCDGTTRHVAKAAVRMYSWLLTSASAVAAGKQHLLWLRQTCLAPPPPPYALSLADSGQLQLLYRAPVCLDPRVATTSIEGLRVSYEPAELADRLDLCGRVAAACGKPSLAESPTQSVWFSLYDRYGAAGIGLGERWGGVQAQPLTRLAAFLTPPREDCAREYPATT